MLLNQPSSALVHQKARVDGLVVIDRKRERHKYSGSPHGCDLSHGAGTGTADDDVCVGKGPGGVVNKGRQFCNDASIGVICSEFVDLLGTTLMDNLRTNAFWHQCKGLRHDVVQGLGPQTSPHYQQLERTAASSKSLCWRSLLRKRLPKRISHPLRFLEHIRKCCKHLVGHGGQDLVGHASNRILLMQDQRLATGHAHQAAGKADVATQAHHHLRLDPANNAHGLPEGAKQSNRQQHQGFEALATHT